MIKHLLKNIRKKPKAVRDNIAMGIAGTFTALVFSFWLYNVPEKFSAIQENDNESSFFSLFSNIKEQAAVVASEDVSESDETDSRVNAADLILSGDYVAPPPEKKEAYYVTVASSTSLSEDSASTTAASASEVVAPVSSDPVSARSIRIVTVKGESGIASTTAVND